MKELQRHNSGYPARVWEIPVGPHSLAGPATDLEELRKDSWVLQS